MRTKEIIGIHVTEFQNITKGRNTNIINNITRVLLCWEQCTSTYVLFSLSLSQNITSEETLLCF